MSRYNGIVAREEFEIARQIFIDAGFLDMNKTRMTQGAVRLEQPLIAQQSLYTFPILNNINNLPSGGRFNTEIRLAQQDSIVVSQIGFFLGNPTSQTDAAWKPLTYPNPFVFTNATQMTALYNAGVLIVNINNDVWVKQWDLMRCYKAPQTQQTAPLGAGSPVDELDGVEDGFFPVEPFIIFQGGQETKITIELPPQAAPSAVDANSRAILIMRGYIAQLTTPVQ